MDPGKKNITLEIVLAQQEFGFAVQRIESHIGFLLPIVLAISIGLRTKIAIIVAPKV